MMELLSLTKGNQESSENKGYLGEGLYCLALSDFIECFVEV